MHPGPLLWGPSTDSMIFPILINSAATANLLVQQLVTLGAHAPPAELSQLDPDDLSAARAATNAQIGRRRPSLVPEFRSFVRLTGSPSDFPPAVLKTKWPLPPGLAAAPAVTHLPPGSKVLGPSLSTRGEDKDLTTKRQPLA